MVLDEAVLVRVPVNGEGRGVQAPRSYSWSWTRPFLCAYHSMSIDWVWEGVSVHGSPTAMPTRLIFGRPPSLPLTMRSARVGLVRCMHVGDQMEIERDGNHLDDAIGEGRAVDARVALAW